MYEEEYEKLKIKVLKYVMYKKRTEYEVKTKFSEYDEALLNKVIEFLIENEYINDRKYIERYIAEIKKLKNMSYKEVKYKLYSKGINLDLLYPYNEELEEYELVSANNICIKKMNTMDKDEIKEYLSKKGYKSHNIQQAITECYESN